MNSRRALNCSPPRTARLSRAQVKAWSMPVILGAGAPKAPALQARLPMIFLKKCAKPCGTRPDRLGAEGGCFGGKSRESGVDVKLVRASAEPTLIGVNRTILKLAPQTNLFRLMGKNRPPKVTPADLDFGSG